MRFITTSFIVFMLMGATAFTPIIPSLTPQAEALAVSPLRIEINLDPGEVYSGTYKLRNDTPDVRTFFSSFENFEAFGESGTPQFVLSGTGLASWMDGPDFVDLEPFEQRQVPFTVTVPEDADPGGYFAASFWNTTPVNAAVTESGGVNVNQKLGILMLITVNGDITEEGGIVEFDREETGLLTTMPVDFFYRFQNDGNDRLKPDGLITVRGLFGVKKVELNPNQREGNVLPLTKRRFEVTWPTKNGSIEEFTNKGFFARAGQQLRHFRFGLYRATLDLTYGQDESLSDNATTRFFVFPWQLLSIALVILTIFGWGGRMLIRRYNQAIIRRAQAQMKES